MNAQSMYQASKESVKNFTREENESLTRVGPGTLMGNLFRQYWIPVTPAADMTEPGGRPIRVKLLGEDLVLFRALNGRIGAIGAFCAHRLAPLFFGRVEEDGLRCPYHGWKFAPDGRCMEMPNIPATRSIIRVIPASSAAGLSGFIWARRNRCRRCPIWNFSALRTVIATIAYSIRIVIISRFSRAASIRPTSCGCIHHTIFQMSN